MACAAAPAADEVGHQVYPLIDTEASTDPVPVYRGSKPPVPINQAKQAKASKPVPAPAQPVSRSRVPRLALLGLVVLAAGALGWQFVRGRPSADAGAANDSTLQAFDHLADSVAVAVRAYGEREREFAAQHADCAVLALGLADVEGVWVSYSVQKRQTSALDATRQTRDQTLDASVDSVDRNFDRTGCQRP